MISLALDWMPQQARSTVLDFLYGTRDNDTLRTSCKTFYRAQKKIPVGVNPYALSVQEVVNYMVSSCKRIILPKKENYAKLELILRDLKNWQMQNSHFAYEFASCECVGGISALMSFHEVELYVQSKFDQLRKSGLLLYRSEFETQENPKKFRRPSNQNLCRLWGAEYLRTQFAGKENYRVPRFIIVVNDGVKNVSIGLWKWCPELISISTIKTSDAELLVEDIDTGIPDAFHPKHRWMTEIGYTDYSGPGNILKAADGNYYVVDTEWTALQGYLVNKQEKEKPGVAHLRAYAESRFATFYPWTYKTVTVSLQPQ